MIIFAHCEPEFGQARKKLVISLSSFCTSFSHKSDSKGWNRTNLTSWCEPPLTNYCLSFSMETGHSLLICPSSSTNQNCAHLKSGYFYLSDEVFRQKSRANIKPSSECSRGVFFDLPKLGRLNVSTGCPLQPPAVEMWLFEWPRRVSFQGSKVNKSNIRV